MNVLMIIGIVLAALLLLAMAAPAAMQVRDALLKRTRALPNGAVTVTSDSIDTGKVTSAGQQLAQVEYLLTAPALTTAQLADTQTITYNVIMSDNADLSSPTTLMPSVMVQTGAGGAGAAGNTYRFRLPSTARRFIGFTAVKTGASNASTASGTLEALF
jgi:hypothetical protein